MSRSLWTTLTLSTLLIFLLGALLGLTDQEAYYWLWSRKLDLCYLEHPALQAWTTRLLTEIFGDSAWVIRFPASVLGRIAGLYFFFRWAELRFNSAVAEALVFCLLGSFFVTATGLIALPDAWLFPFFGLLLWDCERKNFLNAGLWLGLCALSKWTAVFFIPGLIGAIFCQPDQNLKTKIKMTLAAGFIALSLQFPTLYWNATHDFASFRFHLIDRHPNFSWEFFRTLQNLFAFVGSQLILGGLSFLILIFLFFTRKKGKEITASSPLVYWIAPAFLIVGFSALRGELRFYWTAPALIPLLGLMINKIYLGTSSPKRFLRVFRKVGIATTTLSLAFTGWVLLTPFGETFRPLIEQHRSYDMRFSPRGDIEGWREIIAHLKERGIDAQSTNYFLAGSNFRISAQLAWAAGTQDVGKITVGGESLHQLHFWQNQRREYPATAALMFSDNRYRDKHLLQQSCEHLLNWETFEYKLQGKTIKTIDWAECKKFIRST